MRVSKTKYLSFRDHEFADHTPDGQLIDVHLIPVVVFHSVQKHLFNFSRDLQVAYFGHRLRHFELHRQPAVDQVVALQRRALRSFSREHTATTQATQPHQTA